MSQSEDPTNASTAGPGPTVRAQLAVRPHPDSNCTVVNQGEDATDVTHHLKSGPPLDETDQSPCGECHTQFSFDEKRGTYLKAPVTTNCICPVFQGHDCIPDIKAVESDSIIVVLTVQNREGLQEIISDLREVGASITVEWLVNGTDNATTTEIDASRITDKQQEAMELAREMGYYETPRRTDLGEIAAELGVSESAVSQRLNAAETKLVRAFLDDHR